MVQHTISLFLWQAQLCNMLRNRKACCPPLLASAGMYVHPRPPYSQSGHRYIPCPPPPPPDPRSCFAACRGAKPNKTTALYIHLAVFRKLWIVRLVCVLAIVAHVLEGWYAFVRAKRAGHGDTAPRWLIQVLTTRVGLNKYVPHASREKHIPLFMLFVPSKPKGGSVQEG